MAVRLRAAAACESAIKNRESRNGAEGLKFG